MVNEEKENGQGPAGKASFKTNCLLSHFAVSTFVYPAILLGHGFHSVKEFSRSAP